jgi:hypothetical protein
MTSRGTGYYKVPSLKGVWYRSMFGHSGWCATLEDWLDPRRVRDDYVPTGFKPYGAKTYAVKGHPFGLDLSAEDKKALIVFLNSLEETKRLLSGGSLRLGPAPAGRGR